MHSQLELLREDLSAWGRGWYLFVEKRLRRFGIRFETHKSVVVDVLMARRGSYQRPFLHFSLGVIFVVGATSAPILAGARDNQLENVTPISETLMSFDASEYGVETRISEKPRDQVITYTIQKGDTLSQIAEKFGVSVDTIKWTNGIKRDALTVGDDLKIPPVTGVVHKVREGETIYSVAKKYKTEAQKIVNFPFNDFTDLDTFALAIGQTLIVPDGVVAEAPAIIRPAPPVFAGGTGQFLWPTNGLISQYPIWYHMAIDIANSSAPGVASANDGVVSKVEYLRYGYGHHVIISHGEGYSTLYGHMTDIYVKAGDEVKRGQLIGRMGSTGRSTGIHLHFEVRKNGVTQNPLPYLK